MRPSYPLVPHPRRQGKPEVVDMFGLMGRVQVIPTHFGPSATASVYKKGNAADRSANTWTQFTTVRDHTNLMLYWKSPADISIEAVSLRQLIRTSAGRGRIARSMSSIPLTNKVARSWYYDQSNSLELWPK